jgi:hypothetical protein
METNTTNKLSDLVKSKLATNPKKSSEIISIIKKTEELTETNEKKHYLDFLFLPLAFSLAIARSFAWFSLAT